MGIKPKAKGSLFMKMSYLSLPVPDLVEWNELDIRAHICRIRRLIERFRKLPIRTSVSFQAKDLSQTSPPQSHEVDPWPSSYSMVPNPPAWSHAPGPSHTELSPAPIEDPLSYAMPPLSPDLLGAPDPTYTDFYSTLMGSPLNHWTPPGLSQFADTPNSPLMESTLTPVDDAAAQEHSALEYQSAASKSNTENSLFRSQDQGAVLIRESEHSELDRFNANRNYPGGHTPDC